MSAPVYQWLGRFDAPSLWEVRESGPVRIGHVEHTGDGWFAGAMAGGAGIYPTRDAACDALCRMVGIEPFPNEPSWEEE